MNEMDAEAMNLQSPDTLAELLPVSVLTGFLGSGKTTVLNHLMQQPSLRRTLVLINEFGEIGLDHELVSHSADDIIVEMSSGCLCCTIRGDLIKTLRDAPARFSRAGQRWFDRVVIETTGLADPAPILHTLMTDPVLTSRYRLDGVITTVDAINSMQTLARQFESMKQVAMADRLLITKTDLVEPDALQTLQARLGALNPAAPQVIACHGIVDPGLLLDAGFYDPATRTLDAQAWLNAEAYAGLDKAHGDGHAHGHVHLHAHDVNRHGSNIRALCITIDEPVRGETLDLWLETLLLFRGPDFLRIKGIINLANVGAPVVIHGVQHVFHPPLMLKEWPGNDRRSRIVFITRDIDESLLRDTLRIITEAEADSARVQMITVNHDSKGTLLG
jgi:G3E family GTPase